MRGKKAKVLRSKAEFIAAHNSLPRYEVGDVPSRRFKYEDNYGNVQEIMRVTRRLAPCARLIYKRLKRAK